MTKTCQYGHVLQDFKCMYVQKGVTKQSPERYIPTPGGTSLNQSPSDGMD